MGAAPACRASRREGARLAPLLGALAGLALWEALARLGLVSRLFFPPPSFILQTLWLMAVTGKLLPALAQTLFRLGAGLALGGTVGLLAGWAMGLSRTVRTVLNPVVAALHPMPKLALFPIFLVLLGIGEASKIVLVALAAFFPMVINTYAGVRQIDSAYWEAAITYGANRRSLLNRVVLPGSLPMAMTGLRLAANNALVVTIAAEMLSAREGLGATIWMAWQTMRTEEMYAVLFIIAALGVLTNRLIEGTTHRLTPWQNREHHHG